MIPSVRAWSPLLLLVAVPFLSGAAPGQGLTQREMTEDACGRAESAEKQVEALYRAAVSGSAYGEATAKELEASQAAWKQFKIAELALVAAQFKAGGSVAPMCVCLAAEALATARADRLRKLIAPVEGDACGG